MKTLNIDSTKIFCLLLDRMNGKQHLKIENEPFMPLTVEHIGDAYNGEAKLYSLCHYYVQLGDLMQDPEMCFIVVDGRGDETEAYGKVQITLYSFRQANMGIDDESIIFNENGVVKYCNDNMQHEHAEFAGQWLANIWQQGFLKKMP
jgi:hypothetical protein